MAKEDHKISATKIKIEKAKVEINAKLPPPIFSVSQGSILTACERKLTIEFREVLKLNHHRYLLRECSVL